MATIVQEQPRTIQPIRGLTPPARRWGPFHADRGMLIGVLILAVAAAIPVFSWFWNDSTHLWYWITHDRNTHYCHGLDLAMDIRHGNLAGLVHHLDSLRVWGPLHSLLLAPIELVFGPDYRLAVLPSFLGWAGAAILAFLVTRRMLERGGNFAGLTAALFILVSPAQRAFATDIMLESLGSCLTLLCIYRYLIAVQDDGPRRGLWLGVALSLLFLHKYNYWLLVAFGIGLAELTRQPGVYFTEAKKILSRWPIQAWCVRQLRHPLNYVLLASLAGIVWVMASGGISLRLAGRDISITKPHNLVHLAYAVLFLRVLLWLRTPAVWAYWKSLPATFRQAVGLHGSVVAINFLLPQRLANFLWYVSPFDDDQHREKVGFLHGAPYYLESMMKDYHVAGWSMILMAVLLGLAILTVRKCRPGSGIVFWFLLVSCFLTFQHPMLKSRFLHSWIAAEWVLAGVGLAGGLRLLASKPAWFASGIAVAGLAFVGLHAPYLAQPGHAPEGGVDQNKLCTLPIVEAYLPALKDVKNPTMVSTMPIRDLQAWSYQERYGRQKFSIDIKKLGPDASLHRGVLEQWFPGCPSDAVVLVDIPPGSPHFSKTIENRDMSTFRSFMDERTEFRRELDQEVPGHGVRVTVWRRQESETQAAAR